MSDMATKRKTPALRWNHPESPLREKLMDRLKAGLSLEEACRSVKGVPTPQTVFEVIKKDDDFAEEYARAREIGYCQMADEIIRIADTPVEHKVTTIDDDGKRTVKLADDPAHRKLQIEARKWMLSKVLPKIYGDRVEHKHQVERVEKITLNFGDTPPEMIDITPKEENDDD